MKKFLVGTLAVIMAFSLASCGGNKSTVSEAPVSEETAAETGVADIETVAVGNKIATDFVEMTITESGITNSLKTSIKTGNFTRTFGPEDSSETEFAYIKGKITNVSTSNIRNEIMAVAKVGDYTLEEDNLYIYKADGDTVWELSPLVEYSFIMCVEVPNALVQSMDACDFNFAFNEGMESSFSEFEEMGYKYTLKITPEAAAPATGE